MGAAKEAIRQAGIMMEQVKVVREASQAAYDASSALQSNVQVSRFTACSVRVCCLKNLFSEDLLNLYTHWVFLLSFLVEWGHAECTNWV